MTYDSPYCFLMCMNVYLLFLHLLSSRHSQYCQLSIMPQKMLSDTYERIWMYNDTVTMKLMAVDEEKKGQKKG